MPPFFIPAFQEKISYETPAAVFSAEVVGIPYPHSRYACCRAAKKHAKKRIKSSDASRQAEIFLPQTLQTLQLRPAIPAPHRPCALNRVACQTRRLQIVRIKSRRIVRPIQRANVIHALCSPLAKSADPQGAKLVLRRGEIPARKLCPARIVSTRCCILSAIEPPCMQRRMLCAVLALRHQLRATGMPAKVFSARRHKHPSRTYP